MLSPGAVRSSGGISSLLNGKISDMVIVDTYKVKQIAIGTGKFVHRFGTLSRHDGYTFAGLTAGESGYGDQLSISYDVYNNYVYALVYNYYSVSLAADLECKALWIKL